MTAEKGYQTPSVTELTERHLSAARYYRLTYLPTMRRHHPPRLGVFPYNLKNPYISLMYAGSAFDALALPSLWRGLRLVRLGHVDALHIQFEDQINKRTRLDPKLQDARAVEVACDKLLKLKTRGKAFAWTLHATENIFADTFEPHIDAFRDFLAKEAALVHVFNQAGYDSAVSMLGIDPSRVAVIEHPSYIGAYPGEPKIALPPSRRRFLCFGTILPYKGFHRFLKGLGASQAKSKIGKVVVAGNPSTVSKYETLPLEDYAATNLDVDIRYGSVPSEEVAQLFADTDFVVVNYSRGLTSGVVALAMTMGRPVIGTNIGGIKESVPEENFDLLYDLGDANGLERVIERACNMESEEHLNLQRACLEFAQGRHPVKQSERLEQALRLREII